MSNTKSHTPEPWKIGAATTIGNALAIFDDRAKPENSANMHRLVCLISPPETADTEDEANARRIVACVNACAGITTEALELVAQESGNILAGMEKLKQENAALRAVLKEALSEIIDITQSAFCGVSADKDVMEMIRSALESTNPSPESNPNQ